MIKLENISKVYPTGLSDVVALSEINLKIKSGEAICITGKSGSGKTTLLDVITTILTPTTGDYYFNKQYINNTKQEEIAQIRNRHFGFVFQGFYLLDNIDVYENICLPFLYSNEIKPDDREILQIVKNLGIDNLLSRMPNQLSGGQRQRVAIARALVTNPSVIVADEPTGNLDYQTGQNVLKLLFSYWKKGKTLILVTHDNDIAKKFPKVIELVDGKIVGQGFD